MREKIMFDTDDGLWREDLNRNIGLFEGLVESYNLDYILFTTRGQKYLNNLILVSASRKGLIVHLKVFVDALDQSDFIYKYLGRKLDFKLNQAYEARCARQNNI